MRRVIVAACLIVAGILSASPARATEISFRTPSGPLNVGDTFDVDILISDAPDQTFFFGFYLDFGSGLNVVDVVEGAFLGASGTSIFEFTPLDSLVTNVIPGTGSSNDCGADPSCNILATVTLTVLSASNLTLDLFMPTLLSDSLEPVVFPDVKTAEVSLTGTTPVPEPSTLGLVGLGILSLARRVRRRPA